VRWDYSLCILFYNKMV